MTHRLSSMKFPAVSSDLESIPVPVLDKRQEHKDPEIKLEGTESLEPMSMLILFSPRLLLLDLLRFFLFLLMPMEVQTPTTTKNQMGATRMYSSSHLLLERMWSSQVEQL